MNLSQARISNLWQSKPRHPHRVSVLTSTDRKQGTVRRYGQQLDACVVYDNFDYREGIKHQLISNHAEMRSVTTGKEYRGTDIPSGAIYDETAAKIDTYFIAEAIRSAYLTSVKSIFSTSAIPYPAIPTIELLELRKTDSKTLGPILFNEGTLDGSYKVVESIYKHQFQLDDKEFDNSRLMDLRHNSSRRPHVM
ncbi:hypothetical protein B0J13DRAFT_534649 [Dactylonectria estremocensis]|uniref:Uncharacterized protein n=1 Tax=Dactylonectria estremocensis TaxID=1079267 RepID=A0A9P9D030_9HYPO|nr:hypothetical protein B0J13DRAFT_534649 [Dactylonectria estremocensis]